jgi:ribonuclease HI
LHSRANRTDRSGHWSFSLRSPESPDSLTIDDAEPETHGERLELLAVVRGLEAVPQPSRVTLVTPSSYVNRVLSGGLDEWRSSGWRWERHGEMVPVKNADLWRRVDRAMSIHQVHCCSPRDTAARQAIRPLHRTARDLDSTERDVERDRPGCFVARHQTRNLSPQPTQNCHSSNSKPWPYKALLAGMLFARRLKKRWVWLREEIIRLGDEDAYA